MSDSKLVLVDGSSYLFRAYHALPKLTSSRGEPTGAIHGVLNMITKLANEESTPNFVVVFDAPGKTFRDEIYPEYKANRDPAPEELKRQFAQCRRFTNALGLLAWGSPRYEADDLIGTLVEHGRTMNRPSTIVSRDKDLAQLMTPEDVFWDFAGKGKIGYDQVPDVFGVPPEQIADFLALAGDAVDNIKGVPGVGKKTATVLLEAFGSLEGI